MTTREIKMNLFTRLLMALALLGTGSLALAAQEHGDRGSGHGHDRGSHHDDHRGVHDRGRDHDDHRRYDHRRYDHHPRPRYGYNRGYGHAGPHPRWQRGHRYVGPTYVVRDYGHYRLRPPPRGYRWVRANNDYLLVAIATGIILDMAIR